MAVWRNIGTAVQAREAERTVAPPSFDALLGAALAGEDARSAAPSAARAAAVPVQAPDAPAPSPSWRTTWQLVARQAVLMPRSWVPLSAAAFVGAALLASVQVHERFGLRLFTAVVVLLVMLGALMAASPRWDPRRELLFTLPVPPAAVFLARLTVVLCVDVTLAMACSTLVDGPPGWWHVVSSWLGESLLAASCALAISVRVSPAAGSAAGGALWLLGVLSGPQGLVATPLDALLDPLLSTTPWTLAIAVALLGWAVGAMRSFLGTAPSR
ncbi:hypothetical protein [Streptomyces sp. HD]|uniref:hypothetical protein n=1 Tax=Streptomyces sp. HD TaxID=3020892 RepID=UPI00232C1DDA|nr:hypothetical protein [Streptomyces sp. HD]MDC0772903.1 hypothetical protein [Streptomyces sp. HD]